MGKGLIVQVHPNSILIQIAAFQQIAFQFTRGNPFRDIRVPQTSP
jgi:hypothetical protein